MSDHPNYPAPPQPMGGENDRVKMPNPTERIQTPPGKADDAAPITPPPEPDA